MQRLNSGFNKLKVDDLIHVKNVVGSRNVKKIINLL
jgi:TATA-box binding protein (TBP) (component of TFIID and TFIIIB)